MHHQHLKTTDLCFPGPIDAPHWEISCYSTTPHITNKRTATDRLPNNIEEVNKKGKVDHSLVELNTDRNELTDQVLVAPCDNLQNNENIGPSVDGNNSKANCTGTLGTASVGQPVHTKSTGPSAMDHDKKNAGSDIDIGATAGHIRGHKGSVANTGNTTSFIPKSDLVTLQNSIPSKVAATLKDELETHNPMEVHIRQ